MKPTIHIDEVGDILVCDVEFSKDRAKTGHRLECSAGQVFIDVDNDDNVIAMTLITRRKQPKKL